MVFLLLQLRRHAGRSINVLFFWGNVRIIFSTWVACRKNTNFPILENWGFYCMPLNIYAFCWLKHSMLSAVNGNRNKHEADFLWIMRQSDWVWCCNEAFYSQASLSLPFFFKSIPQVSTDPFKVKHGGGLTLSLFTEGKNIFHPTLCSRSTLRRPDCLHCPALHIL